MINLNKKEDFPESFVVRKNGDKKIGKNNSQIFISGFVIVFFGSIVLISSIEILFSRIGINIFSGSYSYINDKLSTWIFFILGIALIYLELYKIEERKKKKLGEGHKYIKPYSFVRLGKAMAWVLFGFFLFFILPLMFIDYVW